MVGVYTRVDKELKETYLKCVIMKKIYQYISSIFTFCRMRSASKGKFTLKTKTCGVGWNKFFISGN